MSFFTNTFNESTRTHNPLVYQKPARRPSEQMHRNEIQLAAQAKYQAKRCVGFVVISHIGAVACLFLDGVTYGALRRTIYRQGLL